MDTLLLRVDDPEDRARGAELLVQGEIVAFPTETVYGLGVRSDVAACVDALYAAKGRPREKRFTVMVPGPEWLDRYAAPCPAARMLAERYWPGPLTLVLPDGRGGDIGLRCPDHDGTRDFLRRAAVPVAAPSANMSGEPPALSAAEVMDVFGGRIAAVLDGGPVRIGTPSTVVRVVDGAVDILREGALGEDEIRTALSDVR